MKPRRFGGAYHDAGKESDVMQTRAAVAMGPGSL
jgi:hypothetical protein